MVRFYKFQDKVAQADSSKHTKFPYKETVISTICINISLAIDMFELFTLWQV